MALEVAPADRLVTMPQWIPELTLGWEAVRWISMYLRQPNGERAGQRFELVDTQLRWILHWYGIDQNGNWLYRRGIRRLSKGSGKSPMAAVLALVEFCAPVRLSDFDPKRPGGVVGKPVEMPWVQVAAVSEDQCKNTMRMVRAFCPKDSRLAQDYQIDTGKEKFFRQPEGTLEQITSSYTTAEGAESTAVLADETEYWLPGKGGPMLMSTLQDNLSKSGNRLIETCNAWQPGIDSVAEASWEAWVAQEEGRTRGESKILYDARIAPPDTDMADPVSLANALRHVYGDAWWVDPRAIMERIWDPASSPGESRRKYLNRPTAADDAWTTPELWSRLAAPMEIPDGTEIVMFFDGSKSRDATALIGCVVGDPMPGYVFTLGIWQPDQSDPDSVVPVQEVDACVERAFDRYRVLGFFADVREWEGMVKLTWPQRYGESLMVQAVPGGREPQPIAFDMRVAVKQFTLAAELTATEIREGRFSHDGDAVLGRHVTNARMYPGRWGVSVRKESPGSPKKIDGCVSMIGARMVWRQLLASKEYQKWKRRRPGKGRVLVLA